MTACAAKFLNSAICFYLELLRDELGRKDADPGGIAAWPCQAGDEPGGDEVVGKCHDRDRPGRLLRRPDRRIAKSDDDSRILGNQCVR